MEQTRKSPRVSVLIPAYNREHCIGETINSVLSQTFTDFELLVCDDGSADGTVAVVRAFDDPRIRVVENGHNIGSPATKNRLISEARGEFCAILDSDDVCYDHRLQTQVDFLDSHPDVDLCSGAVRYIDGSGKELKRTNYTGFTCHDRIKVRTLFGCAVSQTTIMFRREKFLANGLGYIERGNGADDVGMYSKAIDALRFENLTTPLVKYRIWDGQMSARQSKNQLANALESVLYRLDKLGLRATERDKEIILGILDFAIRRRDFADYRRYTHKILSINKQAKQYNQSELAAHFYFIYKANLRINFYKNPEAGKKWRKIPEYYLRLISFKLKMALSR